MSQTHRSDTAFVPGYHHSGDRGLGVRGDSVPAIGVHGPALLYPGLDLPTEAANEFRLVYLTIPAGVTFLSSPEDSSLVATAAADGTYVGTYEAFKDGVSYGTSTYTLSFGDGLSGSIAFDPIEALGDVAGIDNPLLRAGRTNGPRIGLTASGQLIILF